MNRAMAIFIICALAAIATSGLYFTSRGTEAAPTVSRPDIATSPIRRCMNLGGALEAPIEGDWGYTVRARDLALLKAEGFDTVRLPVKWSAYALTDAPYTIDPAFLARVDQIVTWALANDLNIIIDVHHYDELSADPETHLPRLYSIWDQLADHWRLAPPGLIFEFLNEPHDRMGARRVDEMNRELLARIRIDNPDRWVIIGGAGWGHLEGLEETTPPFDARVITTFHYYSPFEFTHQGADWMSPPIPFGADWGSEEDRRAVSKDMDRALRFQEETGMPIFLGEFGVIGKADPGARARWTRFVRSEAEGRGIGWCHWEWATGFPAYDLESETWIAAMRDALITQPPPIRGRNPAPQP